MKLQKFDYQIKDNKKNKSLIVVSILLVALVVGVVLYKSFAAYKVTESYNIIKGSVAEFTNDPLMISYNLVGEDGGIMTTNEIPSNTEYEYDTIKSKCENGNTITYDKDSNTITIGDNAEGLEDTCNIYFNYIPLSKQTLYALGLTMDDVDEENIPYGTNGTGVRGWYAAPDNYGTSYYFYNDGSDTHPIIIINGYTYLIIRINGNGTLRIIQDVVEGGAFQKFNNSNAYVGLMYGDTASADYLLTHSNKNMSQRYEYYNSSTHLADYISNYLGDAIFCNDRTLYKEEYGEKEANDTALGTGTYITYYGPYYRFRNETPTLICERKEDSFTTEESDIGNGLLEHSFGSLTVDELLMTNASAMQSWYTWPIGTISPAYFDGEKAYIYEYNYGYKPTDVSQGVTVNMVYNLKHGLKYTGTGNWGEEYQIVE